MYQHGGLGRIRFILASASVIAAMFLMAFGTAFSPIAAVIAAGGDWTTYMNGIQHNGFTSDSTFTAKNAAQASIQWTLNPNADIPFDSIFGQPVMSQGTVYFGSFDGNEYAVDPSTHQILWQQFLGRTVDYNECNPPEVGVADTATITGGRLFVGGGDAAFYALDASTGAILWRTALGTQPAYFLWGSPTYYKGSIYVGMASFGDCPLVRSFVAKLNATTGAIEGQFFTVPEGCLGAGVWSTPTIDSSTGIMYFDTGNNDPSCSLDQTPLAFSMMAVDTATMSLAGHWQLPPSAQVPDSDWGATVTLFKDNAGRKLVGASNKNGVFYAFNSSNIDQGPVWQTRLSVGGDCPQCGQAAISPAAFDGKWVYAADGMTTINGQSCDGNVRALSPNDGSIKWATCLTGGTSTFPASVLGAVTVTSNIVIVGAGKSVVLIDKRNGNILNQVTYNGNAGEPQPPYFWGSATISNGVIYAGNMDGTLVAIGLP